MGKRGKNPEKNPRFRIEKSGKPVLEKYPFSAQNVNTAQYNYNLLEAGFKFSLQLIIYLIEVDTFLQLSLSSAISFLASYQSIQEIEK